MTKSATLGIISLLALGVVACGTNIRVLDNKKPEEQQQTSAGGGNGSAGGGGQSQQGGSAGAANHGGSGGSAATCDTPAQGTGKQVGDFSANVTWDAPGNTQLALHSFCGKAKAVWMILSAGGCEPCEEIAPQHDKLFQKYHHLGLEAVLVVGADAGGKVATADYAATYKEELGYSDGVYVVTDPFFSKLGSVAAFDPFFPNGIIVDSQMKIRYIGSSGDFFFQTEWAVQQILAENPGSKSPKP